MQYIVTAKGPLKGCVRADGSKNAALPIITATLLASSPCVLCNVPLLTDVNAMLEIITSLGGSVSALHSREIKIDTQNINTFCAPYESVSRLRASFLVSGPLLARFGSAKIPLPGGCPIGSRPIDLHLKGLAALGATIQKGHGYIEAHADRLYGAKIYLDFPSVGATENILMAACLADGQTVIENAAAEPEIVDLADFLNSMGAHIAGAGSDTLTIDGVDELSGTRYRVIPDRIEAGTFMTAAAVTRGCITVTNVVPAHLKPLSAKLREMGVSITEYEHEIYVDASAELCPADIKTLPFPGFPTDMQAQLCSLLSVVPGTAIITETIFENRFMHAAELQRMGADIKTEGRTAVICGKPHLTGARVSASDLRAGAALILAGLAAGGQTVIDGTEHIRRGYADLPRKLRQLGADIDEF